MVIHTKTTKLHPMKKSFWSRLWHYFCAFGTWLMFTLLATQCYIGIGNFCLNLQAGLPFFVSALLLGAATGWWLHRKFLHIQASFEQEEEATKDSKYFWLKFALWLILIPVIYAFFRCGSDYALIDQAITWRLLTSRALSCLAYILIGCSLFCLVLMVVFLWQRKEVEQGMRKSGLSLLAAVGTLMGSGTLAWGSCCVEAGQMLPMSAWMSSQWDSILDSSRILLIIAVLIGIAQIVKFFMSRSKQSDGE